jgi:hypothetical protein
MVINLNKDYETGVQILHGIKDKNRITDFASKSNRDAKPSK